MKHDDSSPFCHCSKCDSITYMQEQNEAEFERQYKGVKPVGSGRTSYFPWVKRTPALDKAVQAFLEMVENGYKRKN